MLPSPCIYCCKFVQTMSSYSNMVGINSWHAVINFQNINKHLQVVEICLAEERSLFILHNQYHCCWWPGDTRSQDISNHGIGLICMEYSHFSTKRVKAWINSMWPSDAIWWHISGLTLAQVMAWCGTKPLLEPMLTYHQWFLGHLLKGNFTGMLQISMVDMSLRIIFFLS